MRVVMALSVVALGTGCAHSSKTAASGSAEGSRVAALTAEAENAYGALDFARCAKGFRASAEADTAGVERAEALYRGAGCESLAGNTQAALELLTLAVQGGYFDVDHLQYNPELAPLHVLAPWEGIVAGARANLAKAPEAPFPVPTLMGVDSFGSRKVDGATVLRVLGLEVGKPLVHSGALFAQKEAALRKQYDLAFAKAGMTVFFAEEMKGSAFVTVDLVDAEDTARLRFLPEPQGQPTDPQGLIARWSEYEHRLMPLQMQGKLDPEASGCQVAHCIGGFGHPELAGYEPEFLDKVPKSLDALSAVLREDADEDRRAAAAYLLAYAPTPEETVRRLVPFIRDPDSGVRNNVLRVLTATQQTAKAPLLDVATVVDATSLPTTMDRNKSVYLLNYLLEDLSPEALKAQRAGLIQQLGERLVAMAALHQPINRDPAVKVLERLSGEKHETAEAWRAWLARQSK
ncbi:HEAT repeat domain-containing protein [Corallococcus llansteffanensis]|uniref:HEAT repeat domain-containing protein n=1 Tax=Corallococcus llansteffanensis TaxID=2316731 RepID=A0A3A8Q9Q5_9BACT|nr:HEAT repeat domain-containing protein [Corallococcus llansteffanensis]RKH62945.1 hypothetical protein D7V93_09385 [Corallococcus llansteffanensis]